jgi:glutaredoxin
MRRPSLAFLFAAASLLPLTPACRKSAPEAPAPSHAMPQTLQVLKDGRWLFTYVEPNGQFSTTDKPETVPETARGMVRVFDPANPPPKNADSPEVYVADLNALMKAGKAPAKPLSREAFETAAIAQLPPGESSALAARPNGGGSEPPPAPPVAMGGDGGAGTHAGGPPVVTIYGTSWCGACRAARQYMIEHKIPFADKDVERDPAAARELAEKANKMGVPTDRVPVIDVRGRLLLGFDRARIEALLGEST